MNLNQVLLILFFLTSCLIKAAQIEPEQETNQEQLSLTDNIPIPIGDNNTCSICQVGEGDCDFVTRCDHHFHFECISAWLKIKKICPYCRGIVSDSQRTENLVKSFSGKSEELEGITEIEAVFLIELAIKDEDIQRLRTVIKFSLGKGWGLC